MIKVQDFTTTTRSYHTCLSVTSFSSALKKDDIYYPQVFLKECRHIEKKVVRHIHDTLTGFFYSSGDFDQE